MLSVYGIFDNFFRQYTFCILRGKIAMRKNYIYQFYYKIFIFKCQKKTLPKRVINRTYFADFNTQKNPKKPQPERTIANILSII